MLTELEVVNEIPRSFRTGQESHIAFREGAWVFNYLVRRKESDRLVVFLPAAMARGKRRVPCFHRHSWASELPYSSICVSDPTIRLSDELLGGWFLGKDGDHVLPRVAEHIDRLVALLEVARRNVVLAGSSLGGFASIALATHLPETYAYSENAQTDLRAYLPGPTAVLERHCFGGRMREFSVAEPERFSLRELIRSRAYSPPMMFVQKASDRYHLENHASPFVQSLVADGLFTGHFEVISADSDPSGHTPLTLAQFLPRLALIFAR